MRSIIFSGEMVRAILDGTKIQTRRVMKPQPMSIDTRTNTEVPYNGTAEFLLENLKCPYGKVGDELYVRETWNVIQFDSIVPGLLEYPNICYRSDSSTRLYIDKKVWGYLQPNNGKWKSPIHMPQWASRITLRITDVRIERLQNISIADAKSEGWGGYTNSLTPLDDPCEVAGNSPSTWFRKMWDSINGKKHTWASNPWVWAITFEVVK